MWNKHLSAVALLAVALLICAAPAARAQAADAPAAADKHNAGDFYSCPMHPEVKSKKKGRCPECKMDLRLTHARPKPSGDAAKAGSARCGGCARDRRGRDRVARSRIVHDRDAFRGFDSAEPRTPTLHSTGVHYNVRR